MQGQLGQTGLLPAPDMPSDRLSTLPASLLCSGEDILP